MPSLHFATSLMAARLLSEVGPVPGAIGWSYALTLGFALVYLGEHYLVDLLAGAALTEGVRGIRPRTCAAADLRAAHQASRRRRAVTEDQAPSEEGCAWRRDRRAGRCRVRDHPRADRLRDIRRHWRSCTSCCRLADLHKTWNRLQTITAGLAGRRDAFGPQLPVMAVQDDRAASHGLAGRAGSRWPSATRISWRRNGAGRRDDRAWALRKSRMSRRTVAVRMIAFMSFSTPSACSRSWWRGILPDRRAARRAPIQLRSSRPWSGSD